MLRAWPVPGPAVGHGIPCNDLRKRHGMESIERFVTGQLAAWEVPGCAVAAVRNGKVVLAGGWGRTGC